MYQPRKEIITKVTQRGCFEVISHSLHSNGYPVAYLPYYCPEGPDRIRKKQMPIHRYIYALHHGPIPAGLHVMHTCDNRLCINPSHLIIGTHQDNMADKVRKGRQSKGETCGRSKLTMTEVDQIRADKTHNHQQLAHRFGIHRTQVGRIKAGKTWGLKIEGSNTIKKAI